VRAPRTKPVVRGLRRPPMRRYKKHCLFCAIFYQKRSFYQARLRTNIGKPQRRGMRFSQDGSRPTLANMFTYNDLLSKTIDVQVRKRVVLRHFMLK
jgi:hypothetical protein